MRFSSLFVMAVAAGRVKRVVDGTPVRPFQYPWVVAILRYTLYKCGGTLLAADRVLTAAHCFSGARAELTYFEVHVHRHNLSRPAAEEAGEVFGVSERWVHPDFDEETNYHDGTRHSDD